MFETCSTLHRGPRQRSVTEARNRGLQQWAGLSIGVYNMYICIHVYMCVYLFLCIFICLCIHISYIHIHTCLFLFVCLSIYSIQQFINCIFRYSSRICCYRDCLLVYLYMMCVCAFTTTLIYVWTILWRFSYPHTTHLSRHVYMNTCIYIYIYIYIYEARNAPHVFNTSCLYAEARSSRSVVCP